MTVKAPDFSFILPVRNQCSETTLFIFDLEKHFEGRPESFEVVIVDDGSRDQTAFVAERLAIFFPRVRFISNVTPKGLGLAAREGILAAKGKVLILLRPNFSLEAIDQAVNIQPDHFRGIRLAAIKLRSSFWPPDLLFLLVWQLSHQFLSWLVTGGLAARFSPITFSRDLGEIFLKQGRVRHSGFQFELVLLGERLRAPIELLPAKRTFFVYGLPLFYFLTVFKEIVRFKLRNLRKR